MNGWKLLEEVELGGIPSPESVSEVKEWGMGHWWTLREFTHLEGSSLLRDPSYPFAGNGRRGSVHNCKLTGTRCLLLVPKLK